MTDNYKPSWLYRNGHLNTIGTAMFRNVNDVNYERERLELPDGDFLDLDWSYAPTKSAQLVIVMHGLEGNANRPYIMGMVKYFNNKGWDAIGLNFRGCSGEMNRKPVSYHMSEIGDMDDIINHVDAKGKYQSVVLVGFSLGGSIILNYLGRKAKQLPGILKAGVAISVPVDLVPSVRKIGSFQNRAYVLRFLRTLNPKMELKRKQFPGQMPKFDRMPKTLGEFDDQFTAPIHGFKDADDYWTKSSPLQYLMEINRPCLLINALDDSFLSEGCYPDDIAEKNKFFSLKKTKYGGHCGFSGKTSEKEALWSEQYAYNFVKNNV